MTLTYQPPVNIFINLAIKEDLSLNSHLIIFWENSLEVKIAL